MARRPNFLQDRFLEWNQIPGAKAFDMRKCNGLPLTFSRLGRRKIRGDFDGGWLTSDAGAARLREVDRRVGLIDAMAACIEDPRDPAKITHDLRTMLAQRVLAIATESHSPPLVKAAQAQREEGNPENCTTSESTL